MRWSKSFMLAALIAQAVCATSRAAHSPATTRVVAEPTRITLKLDHVPAAQAVRELFEKANIPTVGIRSPRFADRLADIDVTCDFVNRPFDSAMIDLFRQCGLEPEGSPSEGQPVSLIIRPLSAAPTPRTKPRAARPMASVGNGVKLYGPEPSWIDGPAFVAGPFLLVASSANRASRWELDGNKAPSAQREMNIAFNVLHDPKTRVWAIADQIDVEEARDDQGRSLLSSRKSVDAVRPHTISSSERSIWGVTATLAYPADDAHRLALLRGSLSATIITRTDPADLLDASGAPKSGKAAGFAFSVTRFEASGEESELSITLDYPLANPNNSLDTWNTVRAMFDRDAFQATDSSGGIYWVSSNVHAFRESRFYDVTVRFRPYQAFRDDPKPPAKPTKIVWSAPADVEDIRVPVEIRDLALP